MDGADRNIGLGSGIGDDSDMGVPIALSGGQHLLQGRLTCQITQSRSWLQVQASWARALPHRSPSPLIVPCTWRAPAAIAASEFATATPESL